jgi:hypothetical protein
MHARDEAELFANTPFLTLFGYTAPPTFPIPLTDLILKTPENASKPRCGNSQKACWNTVLKYPWRSATVATSAASAHRAIEWPGMPSILLTVRDITTMKRRELPC